MNKYTALLRKASSEAERVEAVRMLREATEKHEPVAEAIPALFDVMMAGEADTLVSGTFVLEHHVARGYDLGPAVPALVRALHFTFRHHAARLLINYVNRDQARGAKVMEAIRTSGIKGSNPDLERVVAACTSGIPPKEWRWGVCGVDTFRGCLTWFNEALGRNYSEQTYEEFRKNGAWAPSWIMKEHEVPEEIWQELHQLLGVNAKPRRTKDKIEADVANAVSQLKARMKAIAIEDCSICRSLPERDGEIPEGFSKLHPTLEFNQGGEEFWRCPICGRLYGYEHVVDNEVGASYTMNLFWRTTPDEIGERLRKAAIEYEWTWTIKK